MNEQITIELETLTEEIPESERRASPRVELCVPVEVTSLTQFRGQSGDLSAGGMYVELEEMLPVGSLIDLDFRIPGAGRRFEVLGEIRWANENAEHRSGHGVEFLNLPEEGGRALRDLLDTYDSVYEVVAEVADIRPGVAVV